jgi:hypothetical protein
MSIYRLQGSVNAAYGPALNGVDVYICTQPAVTTTIPPTPLASLFTDSTGSTPLANPVQTDGLGNWFAYLATGTYTVVLVDSNNRIPVTIFPDQEVVSPGGGTVTNVTFVMPAEFTVSGSPITSSGTITITKVVQNANAVYAGPTSGSAAAPTFRPLVAADFTGLVGSVTQVTLAVSASALFTASISGTNPITTSGTATINITFANQAANTILAGPASGSTGPISARQAVAADIAGIKAVTFSATPVFDASLFALPTFTLTLTANITSSSVTNPTAGQHIAFILTQDGTGGWSFVWPANFHGASNIGSDANSVSVQEFIWTGSIWRAVGPGSVNAS